MPKYKPKGRVRDPDEAAEGHHVRLPKGTRARLQKLAKERNWTKLRGPWATESSITREALLLGLAALEERHAEYLARLP